MVGEFEGLILGGSPGTVVGIDVDMNDGGVFTSATVMLDAGKDVMQRCGEVCKFTIW